MKRITIASLLVLLFFFILIPPTPQTLAEPILKPRKYHGPIPKRSFTLGIGFLGGPDNEDMYGYLDELDPRIPQPLRKELGTKDFSTALQLDAAYTVKMHPNFAFRVHGGLGILNSSSDGFLVPTAEQDTSGLAPLLQFERSFDVMLLALEASALYYFQDASVAEFQTYVGGGFSMYLPVAEYKETLINDATGELFETTDVSDTSSAPGVHGILGILYHINPGLSVHLEGRGQIAQSKFTLDLPTDDSGIQPLTFDVDYTGFVMSVGVSKFF